jgi:hypothetical protein
MENTKLTIEEVEKLQEIQQKNAAVANELGNLEVTKLQIEARRVEIIEYFNNLKTEEQTFGKELSEKYGNGQIDLEKGEFIPGPAAE